MVIVVMFYQVVKQFEKQTFKRKKIINFRKVNLLRIACLKRIFKVGADKFSSIK